MSLLTNKLVARSGKMILPAALGAAVLGSALFLHQGDVHASAITAAPLDDRSVSALSALDHDMETLAARVTPAVVNVAVTSRGEAQPEENAQLQDLPPGFAQFFGNQGRGGRQMQRPEPELQHGIGSGVIISPDGYIITNNHVVEGATQIRVTLNDRRVMTAKVIGTDKLTDLAVIKVEAHDLPAVSWGDSAKLEPGQTVLAFGSPFGYFQFSVTRGIVSAINRQNPYSDDARKLGGYIQTDAAINPGNSGGALVNAHGELIGINTWIISNSGSFSGAGFAIPAQIARATAEQIIKTGGVRHGYLGVSMNDVTPENAHFFNLKDASGAIVSQVSPNSPASNAGLQSGDVISQLNGQPLSNSSALQVAVAGVTPGTKVQLGILRDGRPQTINLTVGEYHAKGEVASNASDSEQPGAQGGEDRRRHGRPDRGRAPAVAPSRRGEGCGSGKRAAGQSGGGRWIAAGGRDRSGEPARRRFGERGCVERAGCSRRAGCAPCWCGRMAARATGSCIPHRGDALRDRNGRRERLRRPFAIGRFKAGAPTYRSVGTVARLHLHRCKIYVGLPERQQFQLASVTFLSWRNVLCLAAFTCGDPSCSDLARSFFPPLPSAPWPSRRTPARSRSRSCRSCLRGAEGAARLRRLACPGERGRGEARHCSGCRRRSTAARPGRRWSLRIGTPAANAFLSGPLLSFGRASRCVVDRGRDALRVARSRRSMPGRCGYVRHRHQWKAAIRLQAAPRGDQRARCAAIMGDGIDRWAGRGEAARRLGVLVGPRERRPRRPPPAGAAADRHRSESDDFALYRITLKNAAMFHVVYSDGERLHRLGPEDRHAEERAQHRRRGPLGVRPTSPSRTPTSGPATTTSRSRAGTARSPT